MKSNVIFSSILSVSLLCVSCKKEETTETASDTPKQIIIPDVQATTNQNFGGQQQAQNIAVPQNQLPANTQVITPTQTQVPTKAGMNPPHGQPGHRCDIAVGAPLNSPVKAAAKPNGGATITTMPTVTSTNTATPKFIATDAPGTATPAGTNPPHGQPGHVCGTPAGGTAAAGTPATITPATNVPAIISTEAK
ncbi:hypothetical protein [Flavobacterium sp.]